MTFKPDDEEPLRQYLLGALAPEEQRRLEEQLLLDNELVESLLVIEQELIDDYAREALPTEERERFVAHFLSTPERRRKVGIARALQKYVVTEGAEIEPPAAREGKPMPSRLQALAQAFRVPAWRLPVAAALVLGFGLGVWWLLFHQSPLERGVAALKQAYRDQRPLEARISGFGYAPWSQTRGGPRESGDYVARDRAERLLLDAVGEHPSAEAHQAMSRLYLARGEFDKAIDQFEAALKTEPRDAQLHSDLGAALLEKGKAMSLPEDAGQKLELFARSLEQLSKALELNHSLPEALFNRALCHYYLGLPQPAAADWRKYLEIDPQSSWAEEARRRLGSLEEQKRKSAQTREQTLDDYLNAWRAGDDEKAWNIACQNRESATGKLIFQQLAVAYLKAKFKEQADTADYIKALSALGEWELQKSNDHYITELADFYRGLSLKQTSLLVQAHNLLEQGRSSYLAAKYEEAPKLFALAAQTFRQAGDRWEARFATYLITSCYLQTSRAKESLLLLEPLTRQCESEGHQWLLAHLLATTSRALGGLNQYSKSTEYISRSLDISKRISDTYNVQKSQLQLAQLYNILGNPRRALTFLQSCLEMTGDHWPGARQMGRTYDITALVFTTLDLQVAAAAYEQEALRLATEEIKDPSFSYVSYVNLGYICGKMQRYAEGVQHIRRGLEISQSMSNETAVAWSLLQLGHMCRQSGNYGEANVCYDQAIGLGEKLNAKWMSYDAHKGRLLCYFAQGDDISANRELETALALLEQDRSAIAEESSRNTLFNREEDIYDLAIDFEYSRRNDKNRAFEYVETSRARSLLDLTNEDKQVVANNTEAEIRLQNVARPLRLVEIQGRMPEQAQILQYSVLADKLLIWLLSRSRFEVQEQKISRQELSDKVTAWLKLISQSSLSSTEEVRQRAEELYRVLIAPVEPLLDTSKLLCVSPDEELNYLPFGALVAPQSGRPLIGQYPLILVPSSTIFVASSSLARQKEGAREEKVLSVGDPHFDRAAFPFLSYLPDSSKEAVAVAGQYQVAWPLTGDKATKRNVKRDMERAEVIHIASHYVISSRSPLLSQLLLTAEPSAETAGRDSDGVLHAWEIYTMNLRPARLVVLSACRTGVERYYRGEGAIGAARAFLAAGAPLVVASLWPVDSSTTAELMTDFHSYRKQLHLSSVEALRQAQLKMLNSGRYQQPYYWAAFTAIGGYSTY